MPRIKTTKRAKLPNRQQEKRFFSDQGAQYVHGKLICKQCRAIYDGKHWEPFEKLNPRMVDELKMSICPACHEKINHLSDGVLHLSGSGFIHHKDEIRHLIMNTGKREEQRDILNRIERIDESKQEEMAVYTTKNQLAVELGKKITSAYKGGKLEIQWSKNDKPVEVKWHYDLK